VIAPTAYASTGFLSPAPLAPQAMAVRLRRPGRDGPRDVTVQKLFDNSVSVVSGNGADAVGQRFNEAKRAVRHVARAVRREGALRVGVVPFDQPSVGTTPLLDVHAAGALDALDSALAVPRDVRGSSCLTPSLAVATERALREPDQLQVLAVFSDFALLDPDPVAVREMLANFPGVILSVVLGTTAPVWLHELPGAVVEISRSQPLGGVATALTRALVTGRVRAGDPGLSVTTRATTTDRTVFAGSPMPHNYAQN
jgi:hypothetical protein